MDEHKKSHSIKDKIKSGVSVEEIESIARKYTFEVFMILAIIIAGVSSMFEFFTGPKLSIFLLIIGAIASIAFPQMMIKIEDKYFSFINKQSKGGEIAIGVARIAIALFIPFIVFGQIGVLAGLGFHHFSKEKRPNLKNNDEIHKDENESPDEHI